MSAVDRVARQECPFPDPESAEATAFRIGFRVGASFGAEGRAVDWLDEGRESCLIDGVRYTREGGYEERWAYQRRDGEWTTISGFRAKALQDQLAIVLVPIDQHPENTDGE